MPVANGGTGAASYFNSTTVRLKVVGRDLRNRAERVFQFHYGTVKRFWPEGTTGVQIDFNSTTVRLKVAGGQRRHGRGVVFQFHYGTVKSYTGITFRYNADNFNSTTVRLKGADRPLRAVSTILDFNSTTVRLKAHIGIQDAERHTVFQFHYGTVKSSAPSAAKPAPRYFNSTTVRLKESPTALSVFPEKYFNSTTVRLKEITASEFHNIKKYFNSTTVRLKVSAVRRAKDSRRVISIPLRYG